jgi:hypothetical protein
VAVHCDVQESGRMRNPLLLYNGSNHDCFSRAGLPFNSFRDENNHTSYKSTASGWLIYTNSFSLLLLFLFLLLAIRCYFICLHKDGCVRTHLQS